MMGVGRGQKVEAQFRLTDGPILVLVDDSTQLVDRPMTTRYLADRLAQELIKKKAAKKIIPEQTLDALRQREPDLHRRGCREVGEMVGAKQVLWIEIRDFLAGEQIESAAEAAYITVSVKVISAGELEPGKRARLWPVSPKGRILSEVLAGSDCLRLKTKDAIGRELADKLATQVARLFHDHRLDRLESYK